MKKKRLLLVLLAAVLVGGALLFGLRSGSRPFHTLSADTLESATVELLPPGVTITLSEAQRAELAALLSRVVVYQKDSAWRDYCGQTVLFTLQNRDGTQTQVIAYSPFLVIDGVGYRTEYEPCEALNNFANNLRRAAE